MVDVSAVVVFACVALTGCVQRCRVYFERRGPQVECERSRFAYNRLHCGRGWEGEIQGYPCIRGRPQEWNGEDIGAERYLTQNVVWCSWITEE